MQYTEETITYLADSCDELRDMVGNDLGQEVIYRHIETCEDCQELV